MSLPAFDRRFALGLIVFVSGASTCAVAQSSADFPRIDPFPSNNQYYTYNPTPVAVFFPPDPPPLDRIGRLSPKSSSGYRYLPAPELARYINEPFYPALAALYDNEKLKDRQRTALEGYREAKHALQQELHDELIRIRELPPAERATELAALRARQDPQIAALERRAEDFRTDLLKGDFAWGAIREWHLGESERYPDTAREIANVMRAGAFFQSGLTPDQRTLLREIAIEVPAAAESVEEATARQPYVFFSPGPSRVRFPENIPSELAFKVATYETRRSALRKRLYDVMFREDGAWFGTKRTLMLQSLAREQAPELASLETFAEEIRRDLALVPPAPPPDSPVHLTPVLVRRVISLYQRQNAVQKEYFAKTEEVRRKHPKLNISSGMVRERPTFNVTRRGERVEAPEYSEAEAEMAALAAVCTRSIAELNADGRELTRDLAAFLRSEDPSLMNVALKEGVRLALEETMAPVIADYRSAVFDPGLSPGQRRLLFDYAIEQCDLPLPNGELQPRTRPSRRIGRS